MDMRKRTHALKGFSLVEMLIAVAIIAVLAGMVLLLYGRSVDKGEAVRILSELDGIRASLLTYSLQNATRDADPLTALVGNANLARTEAERHLNRPIDSRLRPFFQCVRIGGRVSVSFTNFPVSPALRRALDEAVSGTDYTGNASGGNYTLSLRVR